MWPFNRKKTIAESGLLKGCTDFHSHILPGVDDGVDSMEEALRILQSYEAAGVKRLWLTPHIMEDIPNTPENLHTRFAELQAQYNGSIELHLAAEYMIDNNLRKLLNKHRHSYEGRWHEQSEVTEGSKTTNSSPSSIGTSNAECIAERVEERELQQCEEPTLLPIGTKGKHILVETSYYNPPIKLHETLKQIKSLGYHPLLAHPERYMYMDKEEYSELHEEGIKFQLNLPSICGAYGNTVRKRALWLLKEGFYNVIGSDTHCEEGLEFIMGRKLEKESIAALYRAQEQSIL